MTKADDDDDNAVVLFSIGTSPLLRAGTLCTLSGFLLFAIIFMPVGARKIELKKHSTREKSRVARSYYTRTCDDFGLHRRVYVSTGSVFFLTNLYIFVY